ncbi:MAG: SAM-dependent chlorinase/fluorinase, partial [Bacteroidia bacterium]|nr:SAM-dependent chlorinase/fluorinase [Bacteroidia bacterium]
QIENIAFVAGFLGMGGNYHQIGQSTIYEKRYLPKPFFHSNSLICHIILIDHFGNVTLNLKQDDFPELGPYTIFVRKYKIPKILKHFSEISDGECMAYWGNDGYLRIAIRSGSASKLLGLKLSDKVSITFNTPLNDNTNRTNAVSS